VRSDALLLHGNRGPRFTTSQPWTYEIKLDGYRPEAVKNAGKTTLYSRGRNVLTEKYPYIAEALAKLK
jgi:ATP-dependent DNA ligase